jgi:tetratricopeptide (TPR) repeat protein
MGSKNISLKGFIVLVVVIFSFSSLFLRGDELSGETFDEANRLYEAGKYTEALKTYREIEQQGAHWKLFYNMGNCYYKLNDFVKAKIYYLRAERLKSFDASIQKNIDIVNNKFSDKIPGEEPDFIGRVIKKIESAISLNAVSVVLLISVLILNLFIFLLIKKGKNRLLIYGVSFSLMFSLLIFSYHAYRINKQNLKDTAVIVKPESTLRSGPGETNTILFKVNPGIKVKIIDKSRDWVQVSASKEIAGWIEGNHIERI